MRAREHWFVTGQTQSGKTTLLRWLLRYAPRWVALDTKGQFHSPTDEDARYFGYLEDVREVGSAPDPGAALEEAFEAIRPLAHGEDLRIAFTSSDRELHLRVAEYLFRVHEEFDLEPTVLVVDEAHRLADGQRPPDELSDALYAGLQEGVVVLSATQHVQQVTTGLRNEAGAQLYLRTTGRLPQDVRRNLTEEQLSELPHLETLTPRDLPPSPGEHLVTYPEDVARAGVLDRWEGNVRLI